MASYQYIYSMHRVTKVVPPNKRTILKDISLSFFPGAKIGVLGLNGSGKSSLLRIMAGIDKDFNGEAKAADGVKVGYLPQEPQLDPDKGVRGNVEMGLAEVKAAVDRFNEVSALFGEEMSDDEMNALIAEQGELQETIDHLDGWDLDRKMEIAADALRLPDWDADVTTLSGGERRRVALARLLLSQPDMLLLDEPTNHLDAESVAWLEQFLANYAGTVVAVTHDRYFLDNVAGWILELDRGEGIPWKGNYSSWLEQKDKRLEQEKKEEDGLRKRLQTELAWVQSSPSARRTKSKARLAAYEDLAAQHREKRRETNTLFIPAGPRLGEIVMEVQNLSKGFGGRLLIDNLNFTLPRGGILGIIGANGSGKTTFLRMLTQQQSPDSGSVRLGETVKLTYVDQSRDALEAEKSVWEMISDGNELIELGDREVNSRAYVSWFNFKGSDQQKKVKHLSGGERNRMHMAHLVKSGGNLLLLDEPTNDLDVETLQALESALLEFPGSAVVVSHDRWFLDRICTHMLAFEGNSEVVFFEGNYQEYHADYKKRCGDDAEQPHRIKYKPVVR
ncbi:ABC transporter related protein [Magnetococcus marinus MC-1]|uniref:Energy-dependent translational throttle protein EttA n=1 Tax=Magnetococcus marinus (strain ATCC BAA-1437 / JCM 17883 / MC-1) TaxID=156889 RepID=A0L8S9_MAGMM|nr:energy-dependent translational throttle protein EttA [Magnetococcus marinus]ABK44372.1 ABC transporter related protein [Magnetococcus marinus MC-1]